jgi:hypothetical protein
MTQVSKDRTEGFLEILNFVVEDQGLRFERSSPLSAIIHRDVIDPETFLDCVAGAFECDPEEVSQDAILPETDRVETMIARLEGRDLA